MPAKISERLAQKLKEVGQAAAQEELPVIVDIKEGSDLAALKGKGLKIQHTYENINSVSGTLPAASVKALAQLDDVQQIDYDGETHALPKKGEAG